MIFVTVSGVDRTPAGFTGGLAGPAGDEVQEYLQQCLDAADNSLTSVADLGHLAHDDDRLLWGKAQSISWLDVWRQGSSRVYGLFTAASVMPPTLPVADDLPAVQVVPALAQGALGLLLESHHFRCQPKQRPLQMRQQPCCYLKQVYSRGRSFWTSVACRSSATRMLCSHTTMVGLRRQRHPISRLLPS